MSWLQTAVFFGGLAVFNLIVCLPFLLFSSVRRLFDSIISGHLFINYGLSIGCMTLFQSVLLAGIFTVLGGVEGLAPFWILASVNIGAVIFLSILAAFLFPYLGWWRPKEKEDETDGRIVLFTGILWYMVSTGAGLASLMFFLIAFFFPS